MIMDELKSMNSQANWSNLAAGALLVILLALGSLYVFSKTSESEVSGTEDDQALEDVLNDENASTETGEVDGSATGIGGGIEVLPNTSSK